MIINQPRLVIFFCIFEKKYNDWIKSFSKSKWTGLECENCFLSSDILRKPQNFDNVL